MVPIKTNTALITIQITHANLLNIFLYKQG